MPWLSSEISGFPTNGTTNNEYKGVNVLLLWLAQDMRKFTSTRWASYKQWKAKGRQVLKGQKGNKITFFTEFTIPEDKRRDSLDDGKRPCIKWYTVFNECQLEGYQADFIPEEKPSLVERINAADRFISNTGARITNAEARAYFNSASDHINMPPENLFIDTKTSTATECYYSTLLHELTHWTGHESRLKRKLGNRFKSQAYAAEELIAEIGSTFLCKRLEIEADPREDHAQYLKGWLKLLKSNKKAIFTAASAAQKAADYLFELQEEKQIAA